MKRSGLVKLVSMLAALLLAAALCACSPSGVGGVEARAKLKLGEDAQLISEVDTHGGFHGDGDYLAVVKVAPSAAESLASSEGFVPLPLGNELTRFVYGDYVEADSTVHSIPAIINGAYMLYDRFAEQYPDEATTSVWNRAALNFTLTIVDLDNSTVYVYEIDT